MSPFGDYPDFDTCVKRNSDKENPEAYCATIKRKIEGDMSNSDRVFHAYNAITDKYPKIDQKKRLELAYRWNLVRKDNIEKAFDCNEFWSFVQVNTEDLYQIEVDFYNVINDMIVQDAEKGAGAESYHRSGKTPGFKAGSPTALSKGSKTTKVGQSLIKTFGSEIWEIGSPDQFIKIGNELVPLPSLQTPTGSVRGRTTGYNRPMTPVMSSNVMGRAVRGNNLYVQFHGSEDKVYKYMMSSPEEALEAFEEMSESSPGRYVWNNLRGQRMGPVFGKPSRQTQGGTSASIVPYDKLTYGRVKGLLDEIPSYEKLSKEWQSYKMAVKAKGEGATSGEPFTVEEIRKFQEEMGNKLKEREQQLEDIRAMFEKKGYKDIKNVVGQLPKNDLVEDMKLNLNSAELRLLLETLKDVNKEDPYYNEVANSIAIKINNQVGNKFPDIDEQSIEVMENRDRSKLITINNQLHDIIRDVVDESADWNEIFWREVDELNENISFEALKDYYHDVLINVVDRDNEWAEAFSEKVSNAKDVNEFLDIMSETIREVADESEEWKLGVKKELESYKEKSNGKGKGWHGEPERHSKARKEGHADMGDFNFKSAFELEKEKDPQYGKKEEKKSFSTKQEKYEYQLEKALRKLEQGDTEAKNKITRLNLKLKYLKEGKNLEKLPSVIEREIMKKERKKFISQFKIPQEEVSSRTTLGKINKGRGWYGESKRHSQAAKKGSKEKQFKQAGLKKWDLISVINDITHTKKEGLQILAQSVIPEGYRILQDSFMDKRHSYKKKIHRGRKKVTLESKKEKKNETQESGVNSSINEEIVKEEERKIKEEIEKENDFTHIESDFMPFMRVNDSALGGYITRDGAFLYYDKNGNPIVKYKEWDNIKESYGNLQHLIAYGSRDRDSHTEADERMIGYFDSFELVPKGEKGPYPDKEGNYVDNNYNRVAVKLHTNKDILDLTDLDLDQAFAFPVSASYDDFGHGNLQHIGKLHHGAVSLNKNETDRCSTLGGSSCNLSLIRDFLEVNHDHLHNDIGVLNADISQLPIK